MGSKSTGIISSKNTVAGQKDLIKWPNVLGPALQSLVTLLAFQLKLKREKSNLSVQTVLPQEKKLKLCESVVGKSRKISGDNRIFGNPNFFNEKRFQKHDNIMINEILFTYFCNANFIVI